LELHALTQVARSYALLLRTNPSINPE